MRIIELTEKENPTELIRRDCQPFLQEADDPLMLYRGMEFRDDMGFIKKKARLDNRRPKAMGSQVRDVVNEYFVEEFGFPYRNGVFCVPNRNIASSFGIPHHVFPIGKFKYLWSPKVDDLNYALDRDIDIMPGLPLGEDTEWEINEIIESYKYRDFGLNDAADFGHEIMIWCLEYYAIPYSHVEQFHPAFFKREILK